MSSNLVNKQIADRYSKALFNIAKKEALLDVVEADLSKFKEVLQVSSEFKSFITSKLLSRDEQLVGIKAIAEKLSCNALTIKFLSCLAKNRRLAVTADIISQYENRLMIEKGELKAEIISTRLLTTEELNKLSQKLSTSTGKKIRLENKVDPKILGGIKVKVGPNMVDASLRAALHNVRLLTKDIINVVN